MAELKIDFNKTVRSMKPMHGVNNGPWTCNFTRDARHLFKEAGIPISRLSDTEYPFGNGEFIDINCIFKDFSRDVNDPEAYNFDLSDLYIAAIVECNTKILYRLGCSIEHQPIKRYIYPPKDYKKWAEICEHIIMHYNEGWADGFHYNIEYFEIWAEPNHSIDRMMWGGDAKDFAHFYDTVATDIKQKFPNVKVGGPAFSSPRGPFVEDFFTELTKGGNHPPMDFFSWHGYVDHIELSVERSEWAQETLKKYGYQDAESIYDEWNYVKSWSDAGQYYGVIQSFRGAAFCAAMMARMQSTTCDMMTFYDAQMRFAGGWNSLFCVSNAKVRNGGGNLLDPKVSFFAFKGFNEVYKCKNQVEHFIDGDGLYAVAASDSKRSAILLASYKDVDDEIETQDVKFDLKGVSGKTVTLYITNETSNMKKLMSFTVDKEFSCTVRPYDIILAVIE